MTDICLTIFCYANAIQLSEFLSDDKFELDISKIFSGLAAAYKLKLNGLSIVFEAEGRAGVGGEL